MVEQSRVLYKFHTLKSLDNTYARQIALTFTMNFDRDSCRANLLLNTRRKLGIYQTIMNFVLVDGFLACKSDPVCAELHPLNQEWWAKQTRSLEVGGGRLRRVCWYNGWKMGPTLRQSSWSPFRTEHPFLCWMKIAWCLLSERWGVCQICKNKDADVLDPLS